MKITTAVAGRISMLRTLLIIAIVFLHTNGTPDVAKINFMDISEMIRAIFQDRLGRFGVPTLSLISGYLLFSNNLDQSPMKLYKKKFNTLIIPFAFFNIFLYAVQYVIEYKTGWAPLYVLTNSSYMELINGFFGITTMPFNASLHFLRDLFVLVILAPVFGFVLRRYPYVGLVIVWTVFMSGMDGHLINRKTMAVMFYVGGMAATQKWDVTALDRYADAAFVLLLSICAAVVFLRISSETIVYVVSPVLVWVASSKLIGSELGNWAARVSKYSFFVFLSHSFFIRAAELGYAKAGFFVSPLLYSIIVTTVTVVTLAVIYEAASIVLPNAFNLVIGSRAKTKVIVERRRTPRPSDSPVFTHDLRMTLLPTLSFR